MLILINFSKLDIIFISIISAIVHNLSQVFVAIFVLGSINIISIVPLSIISGILTGLIIGILSKIILKRI
jgi:heptaprenyl diphosphate synthase